MPDQLQHLVLHPRSARRSMEMTVIRPKLCRTKQCWKTAGGSNMTLRNGKLATKVIALLLGSASLGATAFAQAQKSAAPAQAVKPGAVAAPTPSPTPTPG